MNEITLTGYVCKDPKVETTKTGKTVINFTLSVYAKFRKDGDKKYVSFFDCVYWPNEKYIQSEVAKVEEHALLCFDAEPIQERWEDNGNKRSRIKFNVSGFLSVMKHHSSKESQEQTPIENQGPPDDDMAF